MASEDPGVGRQKVFIRPRRGQLFQADSRSESVKRGQKQERNGAGVGIRTPESTGTDLSDLFPVWGERPHQC